MSLRPSMGLGARPFASSMKLPPMQLQRRRTVKHDWAGYGTLRAVMEFAKWAHEQERFPTIEAVQTRFNVCRATAFRWTRALGETYGIPPETRHQVGGE